MKQPIFQGICTAMVTPFENGDVNIPMLRRLLSRQMKAGIRANVICGTTGEAPTLSDPEKLRMFREAKNWVGQDGIILAGTGSNCTEHAVSLSKAAEDQGVDGLLIVTPYYNKATPQGLVEHYAAIAREVSIPILLYNVPSRTGVDIPVEVYRQLAEIPNIAGVKEASPDLRKIAEIRASCPEDFCVYSGNDDLLLPVLSLGGKGLISVASNVCPEEMVGIWDDFQTGDLQQAQSRFLSQLPLMKALFSEVNPIPVKAAMKCLGLDCGNCRLPLTSLTPQHLAVLNQILNS